MKNWIQQKSVEVRTQNNIRWWFQLTIEVVVEIREIENPYYDNCIWALK